MDGKAPLSPKTKGVADLKERKNKLEKYENWCKPTKMDFESIVGKEKWDQHWENWEKVQDIMREAQKLAEKINSEAAHAFKRL